MRPYLLFTALALAVMATGCSIMPPNGVLQTYDDPFDGPTRGFVMYLDQGRLTAFGARKAKGPFKAEILVVERGQRAAAAEAGTIVALRVGEETHEWPTTALAKPVSNVYAYNVITQWKLPLVLDDAQAKVLADAPLEAIRVTIDGEQYTVTVEDDDAETIQKHMKTLTGAAPAG